jgi:hypothetical protein
MSDKLIPPVSARSRLYLFPNIPEGRTHCEILLQTEVVGMSCEINASLVVWLRRFQWSVVFFVHR